MGFKPVNGFFKYFWFWHVEPFDFQCMSLLLVPVLFILLVEEKYSRILMFRSVFRTRSNVYNETFCENSFRLKAITVCEKKLPHRSYEEFFMMKNVVYFCNPLKNVNAYFMQLIFFYTPWKHQKTSGYGGFNPVFYFISILFNILEQFVYD